MTEREKLLSGLPYDTRDAEVLRLHTRARKLLREYNSSDPEAAEQRRSLLRVLLGRLGEGIWIEPPFFCDYGANIHIGDRTFVNMNCTVLDGGQVRIGSDVLIGPGVHIYAVNHPVEPEERFLRRDDGTVGYITTSAPVVIEDKVWIGGNTVILPGVAIGEGSAVGAGSVVTKSLPPRSLAFGNPCRVRRQL